MGSMERILSIVNTFMDKPFSVGSRLREERERLGLNQEAFARLTPIGTRQSQSNYEKDASSPDAKYFAAIAAAGADVLYIITGERRSSSSSVSFQPLVLRRAIEVAEEELQAKPVRLTSAQKAEFITLLYEHFSSPEQDKQTVVDLFLSGAVPQSVDKSSRRGALKASATLSAKSPKFKQLNRSIR